MERNWNTLTLNELLNKVDLNNFQASETESGHKKEAVVVEEIENWQTLGSEQWKEEINITYGADPSSAYLGPKLWDKTISIPLFNDDVDDPADEAVVSFDKFIKENNLEHKASENKEDSVIINVPVEIATERPPRASSVIVSRPSLIVKREPSTSPSTSGASIDLPQGNNDFLYAESKKAKLEREKAEKRRRFEESLEFDSKDLQLATVPGQTFDPRKRSFDIEELRPQPIVRKRKRTLVPEQEKDEQYWDKRLKNNLATKRAREAKRLKENQIALRAAFLEKENKRMKEEIESMMLEHTKVVIERDILKRKLAMIEG